jgi:arylsulfatase A-like enzyme
VGLADLMPTVLDITGTPIPEGLHGRSLLPCLTGEQKVREHQVVVYDQNFGITDGRWNYCWFGDTGHELLFDLDNDPRECNDIVAEQPEIRNDLRQKLYAHLAGHDDRHCVDGELVPQAPKWPVHHAALKDKAMHRGRC